MTYLEINNNQDLLEVVKNIKAEKNLITCVSAYEDFLENFSCKPDRDKFPYPKIGSVIDEEKSVKWNREEVNKQRKAFETRVEDLNKYKNLICLNFKEQISRLLAKENHITIEESNKIFDFAYKTDYTKGIRAVVDTYKALVLLRGDLLDIHDNKKKPVIHTSKIEADDIDKVVEELKENSSNFKKSYKRDNNMKFHKTYKAIQLNKAIEIVKKINKDRDYISDIESEEEYDR